MKNALISRMLLLTLGFGALLGAADDAPAPAQMTPPTVSSRPTSGEAAALQTPAASTDSEYFPDSIGDSWVYGMKHKKEGDAFDMKVDITENWKDDVGGGVVMAQKDKRGQMREFLLENEKGVFIRKLGLSKSFTPEVFTRFNPSVPRVIYPLVPGTKVHWEGRLKIAMVNKPIKFDGEVVGFEDIEVPAGKFHCVKVFYKQVRGEDYVEESAWYAKGVGQVKYDSSQYVKELKSYKIKP